MTNTQAGVNISVGYAVLAAMLTALLGEATANDLLAGETDITKPAGTTVIGKLIAAKTAYDAAPTSFVSTPANITGLDAAVDGIVGLEIQDFATVAGEAYTALQAAGA